jgi:hypothetical protein
METTKREVTIVELAINLVGGAVIGTIATLILGMIRVAFYLFGPACIVSLVVPAFWLLTAIGGTASTLCWLPLGALIGAFCALGRLCWVRQVPKKIVYPAGGILFALILVVLGFLIVPPGHQDRVAIAERYTQFNESFNNGNYELAYSFMSPTYRQTHTIETFKSDFDFLAILDGEPLEPGYSVILFGDKANLCPDGPRWGLGIVWSGREYELEKIEGVWYFTGEYEFYLD